MGASLPEQSQASELAFRFASRHFFETRAPLGNQVEDAMDRMSLADCPIRSTIKVIGAKWKPQILYKLSAAPHHFGELRRLLGATQKVLTQELRELEREGIVERHVDYEAIPRRVEYSLSEYGQTLQPILKSMCDGGVAHGARHQRPDRPPASRVDSATRGPSPNA